MFLYPFNHEYVFGWHEPASNRESYSLTTQNKERDKFETEMKPKKIGTKLTNVAVHAHKNPNAN